MLTVNIREIARSPKKVLEEIKKSKQPKLIVSQKKPQAVIMSLEEYEEFWWTPLSRQFGAGF